MATALNASCKERCGCSCCCTCCCEQARITTFGATVRLCRKVLTGRTVRLNDVCCICQRKWCCMPRQMRRVTFWQVSQVRLFRYSCCGDKAVSTVTESLSSWVRSRQDDSIQKPTPMTNLTSQTWLRCLVKAAPDFVRPVQAAHIPLHHCSTKRQCPCPLPGVLAGPSSQDHTVSYAEAR